MSTNLIARHLGRLCRSAPELRIGDSVCWTSSTSSIDRQNDQYSVQAPEGHAQVGGTPGRYEPGWGATLARATGLRAVRLLPERGLAIQRGVGKHRDYFPNQFLGCASGVTRAHRSKRANCLLRFTGGLRRGFDTRDLKEAKALLEELAA
jgi:hypothetical protein